MIEECDEMETTMIGDVYYDVDVTHHEITSFDEEEWYEMDSEEWSDGDSNY